VSNSIICKGDNGRWQANYSNIAGSFAGAAISSTYYPTTNQASVVLSNGFIRMGESSLAGVMQEFVVRKFMKQSKRQAMDRLDTTAESVTKSDSNGSTKQP